VPYQGINVVIQVKGGPATVRLTHDGVIDDNGTQHTDGWSTTVVGTKDVCVFSGYQARIVYITVNGTSYGPISTFGGTHAYVDTSGVPKNVNSC